MFMVYPFIQSSHIIVFYILLIPSYLLAIHLALQGFKEKNIITKPKQSILFTILLYIGLIITIYFKFLQYDRVNVEYYFGSHIILSLTVFYFLRWKLKV